MRTCAVFVLLAGCTPVVVSAPTVDAATDTTDTTDTTDATETTDTTVTTDGALTADTAGDVADAVAPVDSVSFDSGPIVIPEVGAHCCPISPMPMCCMKLGGVRVDSGVDGGGCGWICDNIALKQKVHVDDAGCPFWRDEPDSPRVCTPWADSGLPP